MQSLGGIVVLLVGSWELLPLMAFVTQHQIQKVRNCTPGRDVSVVQAGDATCKIWSLLVNL